MFIWFDFLIYALVTAITPGPNNIMSMSNAGRLGFKKALPFNLGIFGGFLIVVSLCTFFSSLLSVYIPVVELPMLLGGAGYIMFLAWKTWQAKDIVENEPITNSFFCGLVLQFINPKLYIYSIVSMDAYILPYYGENIWVLVFFAFLLSFIGFACTLLWSGFGSMFKLLFSKHARITNAIMSFLLVYCAVSMLATYALSQNMKFFMMFATVLFIGCTYISLRLIPRTSLSGFKKYFAYALCYLPFINIPVRYEVRNFSKLGETAPVWLDMMLFASFILIGTLSVVATVTIVTDVFLLAKWIIKRLKKSKLSEQEINVSSKKTDASRRLFLQNSLSAGVVAVSAGFVGYGLSEAMGMPDVKHVRVPVQNLPSDFHGFSIVQLTDLHINKPVPFNRIEKIVQNVNSLKADAIVITGDLSDSDPLYVQKELQPLSSLKAMHGKYFVSGNHEYYTGIEGWIKEVARLGLTNLHNEHRVIERNGKRLLMCGVPDISAPTMSSHVSDPILAQQGSQDSDIKILLAHQPQSVYNATKVGYHVQISGHTHGGQLFPWTYVTDFVQPYIHGLYKVENTQLYVSRGTGYWGPPIRIGAPPEITLLELVSV